MKYSVWGTGSSAADLLSDLGDEGQLVEFIETRPKLLKFRGKRVASPSTYSWQIDKLYVASMYYPEIIRLLADQGFPLEKIQISISHRDDPRFGPAKIDALDVYPLLQEYELHSKTIIEINEELGGLSLPAFTTRLEHLSKALDAAPSEGLVLEFGVYRGESLFHLARNCARPVWGFDSFAGFNASHQNAQWLFDSSSRRTVVMPTELLSYPYLIRGFFEETLDSFINFHAGQGISLVHYDAGSYEAAVFVLNKLIKLFLPTAVIVFDEFVPTPTDLEAAEYRAFKEILYPQGWRPISRSGDSVAVSKTT